MNLVKRKQNGLSPFGLFDDLENDLSHFFGKSFLSGLENFSTAAKGFALDLRDEKNAYVVEADLPGMAKEDIKVKLEEGILTIQGKREQEKSEKGYYERRSGSFERQIVVPDNVREEDIKADYKNGTLKVRLPKTKETKQEAIDINID